MNGTRTGSLVLAALAAFMFAFAACGPDNGDGNGDDGNGTMDATTGGTMDATTGGGTDAGGTDAGGTDAGGTGGDDAGGTGGDDAGTTDADGGMDADTGGGEVKSGSVNLVQTNAAANIWNTSGSASFTISSGGAGESGCTTNTSGNCTFTECPENGGGSGTSMAVSAGKITVSGGMANLEMSPDGMNNYSATKMQRVWDGSHTLTIEAAGDTVPAFSGQIQPPSGITLQSPDAPSATGGALTVDTTKELPVQWDTSGVSAGKFAIQLSSANNQKSTVIQCIWDATSGSEAVPSQLLGNMVKASDGGYAIGSGDRATTTAGDFNVQINAIEPSKDGDGDLATGTAEFQ